MRKGYRLYFKKDRMEFERQSVNLRAGASLISFGRHRDLPEGDGSAALHSHSYLEIFWFLSGKGYLDTVSGRSDLGAHQLLVIAPGVEHRQFSVCAPTLTYYALGIRLPESDDLPEGGIIPGDMLEAHFRDCRNPFYRLIREIDGSLNEADPAALLEADGAALRLLAAIVRLGGTGVRQVGRRGRNRAALREVRAYLEEHYAEKIDLDGLAKRFFLSVSALCHDFKREYGIAPIHFLAELRMTRACELLLGTDLSVTEIGRSVGYGTSSQFTHTFRKARGMSPSEYRVG